MDENPYKAPKVEPKATPKSFWGLVRFLTCLALFAALATYQVFTIRHPAPFFYLGLFLFGMAFGIGLAKVIDGMRR